MALLHRAELRPTKLELASDWLPTQPWFNAANGGELELQKIASFRFDDPAGEVGIETLLVRANDGAVMQLPMTYRAAPLAGAEQGLIGTMEHSVLGTRWTYDGCGDPVYASALAEAIFAGGTEAELYYEVDGMREPKRDTTHVRGSGRPGTAVASLVELSVFTDSAPLGGASADKVDMENAVTVIESNGCRLAVARFPATPLGGPDDPDVQTLTGTWDGLDAPVVLATARLRG